jgi:hypothetical protein
VTAHNSQDNKYFLQKLRNHSPNNSASHPRKLEFLSTTTNLALYTAVARD